MCGRRVRGWRVRGWRVCNGMRHVRCLTCGWQVIVAQGDVADSFYILAEGAAAAYVDWEQSDGAPRRIDLCRYGPGDFFGERGLLGSGARVATVVSVGGCVALRMARASFARLAGWMHGVADCRYPLRIPEPPGPATA